MLLVTTTITAVVTKSSDSYASAGIDHIDKEQLVNAQKGNRGRAAGTDNLKHSATATTRSKSRSTVDVPLFSFLSLQLRG